MKVGDSVEVSVAWNMLANEQNCYGKRGKVEEITPRDNSPDFSVVKVRIGDFVGSFFRKELTLIKEVTP